MLNKLRIIRASILLFSLIVCKYTIAQGIKFNNEIDSLEEFENSLAKSNKITLLIAFSSHCDVCSHMDTAVYCKKEIGKFFNKNFNTVKIDLDKEFANQFINKYEIYGYPAYLFFNKNGVLIHRQKGGVPLNKFLELGKNAIDPNKQFLSASHKYQNGTRELDFCKYLAESATEMNQIELQKNCVDCYLDKCENWESEESVKFIFKYTESIQDRQFQFAIKHINEFEKIIGPGKFSEKIDNIILKDIYQNSYDDEIKGLDTTRAKEFATKYLPPNEIEKALWLYNSDQLYRKKDSINYINSIFNYFIKFPSKNGYLITNLTRTIAKFTNDSIYLNNALVLSQRAYLFKPEEKCYLNSANIAIKLNNYKKAYEILLEGQEYSRTEKMKFYELNELIIQIKQKI